MGGEFFKRPVGGPYRVRAAFGGTASKCLPGISEVKRKVYAIYTAHLFEK
jgi:hypothetical protein